MQHPPGRWGEPNPDVDMSEPCLAAAAAAAAAAAGASHKEAIAAAITAVGGREAAEAFGLTP